MAKQKGIIKLKGTIDDVSFYKSADGYLAREKGGVDGDRIKNDAAFQRTRENNAEFKEVSGAVDLFCKAFREILTDAPLDYVRARLMKKMYEILNTDTISRRGERKISNGNIELLEKFEFMPGAKYKYVFRNMYGVSTQYGFDEQGNELAYITSGATWFNPREIIVAPPNATHFRMLFAGGQIDFADGTHNVTSQFDVEKLLSFTDGYSTGSYFQIEPHKNLSLFLLMSIQFSQLVGNKFYPIKGGAMVLDYAKKVTISEN